MDLPLDILRLILLLSRINDIKSLRLVDKTFNSLCSEKILWLSKFKEKDLTIINNNLNTFSQYLNEYKKVSFATYTTNCLYDMIRCDKFDIMWDICAFDLYFSIDELTEILVKNHDVFIKITDNIKKYIRISMKIRKKVIIRYRLYDTNKDDKKTNFGTNIHADIHDKHYTILLINKILYNYPAINIIDDHGIPLVFSKYNLEDYNIWYRSIHPERKVYWDECYTKYEELYF